MDPLLLSAEDPAIKDHKNHKARQPWIDHARTVLAKEGDKMSGRPFEERVSLAAASHHFLFGRLG